MVEMVRQLISSYLIVLVFHRLAVDANVSETNGSDARLDCMDWKGEAVPDGAAFKSRLDPCETCLCEGGHSVRCMSVRCGVPDCDMWETISGECCKFICIEPADKPHDRLNRSVNHTPSIIADHLDRESFSLRLAASTLTSLLILVLLLFMVHRLRQRRILIMMQRMNDDVCPEDAVGYVSDLDNINMGVDMLPYEEPPPPYTPPKPTEGHPTEAPPPYEVSDSNAHSQRNNFSHRRANSLSKSGLVVRLSNNTPESMIQTSACTPSQFDGVLNERQDVPVTFCVNGCIPTPRPVSPSYGDEEGAVGEALANDLKYPASPEAILNLSSNFSGNPVEDMISEPEVHLNQSDNRGHINSLNTDRVFQEDRVLTSHEQSTALPTPNTYKSDSRVRGRRELSTEFNNSTHL